MVKESKLGKAELEAWSAWTKPAIGAKWEGIPGTLCISLRTGTITGTRDSGKDE